MTAPFDHYLTDTDAFEATVLAQRASTRRALRRRLLRLATGARATTATTLESRRRIEARNPRADQGRLRAGSACSTSAAAPAS